VSRASSAAAVGMTRYPFETLEARLLKHIDRKRGDVFLRADGGYDQVGWALRGLVRDGVLSKSGKGFLRAPGHR
jgi:hypothetical protein